MRALQGAALWLCAFTAGCVQTNLHTEAPALLTADAANIAILQDAVQKALGQPVTLAGDALTRDSTLVIEATPARVGGQRIDGREIRPPERFTLLRMNSSCLLRRESTGERLGLRNAKCRALQ